MSSEISPSNGKRLQLTLQVTIADSSEPHSHEMHLETGNVSILHSLLKTVLH